ncbi:CSKMT methyltransferase, partial [Polypterus senegalus]
MSVARACKLFGGFKGTSVTSRLCSSLSSDLLHSMHKKEMWDNFYVQKQRDAIQNFDWFFNYRALSGLLHQCLNSSLQCYSSSDVFRILDLGCGISDVGLGLFQDLPEPVQVICTDISPVAIAMMQQLVSTFSPIPKHSSSELRYVELDCTRLDSFHSGLFNLILDKGTTDAFLRSAAGKPMAIQMLMEALRVLHPSGSFLQFSDEDPDARIPWLESSGVGRVKVNVQELTLQGASYYVYIINLK